MTSGLTMARPVGVVTRNQETQAFISSTHIGLQCPANAKEEKQRYAVTFSSAGCQTEAPFSVDGDTHSRFQRHACCEKCKLFACQCAVDRGSCMRHAGKETKGEKHSYSHLPYASNSREPVEEHEGTNADKRPWRASLVVHENMHSIQDLYTCSVCQEHFLRPTDLSLHQEMHTAKDFYTCPVCPELFLQKNDLIDHTKAHTTGKPNGRDIDHKLLPLQTGIADSKKLHAAEVSVQDVSQMFYFELMVPANNKAVRASEYPYACGFCPARFAQKISLAAHMKRHAGNKPQTCSVCHKSFCQGSGLALHMRVHTREKANICQQELSAKKTF